MTHAYYQLIRVESRRQGEDLIPTAFTWRGKRYQVLHVNETWQGGEGRSDRWYWRVVAKGQGHTTEITYELYRDAAQKVWVLERIYD